jgi:hypothetical protein
MSHPDPIRFSSLGAAAQFLRCIKNLHELRGLSAGFLSEMQMGTAAIEIIR